MCGQTNSMLDSLMDEWRLSHQNKGCTNFISDGIVNIDKYKASSPKICFFLKEAYSRNDDGDWCLTEWLANGAMTKMWGNVAEWSYGILNTSKENIPPRPHLSNSEKTSVLHSISVVNVKKSNGKSRSDYKDLLECACADYEFLKKELDIIKPDVLVCGNNSSLLRLVYGASILKNGRIAADGKIDFEFMRKNGFAIVDNQIILDCYHPANQYPAIMNYYTVCCLYQQALKMKG